LRPHTSQIVDVDGQISALNAELNASSANLAQKATTVETPARSRRIDSRELAIWLALGVLRDMRPLTA
jgi:hypothetical protein